MAEATGAESIAIAPISTNIYGFHLGEVGRLTFEVVQAFLDFNTRRKAVEELSLVFGEEDDVNEVEYHNLFPLALPRTPRQLLQIRAADILTAKYSLGRSFYSLVGCHPRLLSSMNLSAEKWR